MPRPKAGARLYLRPDTDEWVLRDSGKPDRRLGLRGQGSRGEAEKALARYLSDKHQLPSRPQAPSDVPVAMVLTDYVRRRGDDVAAPERIGHAIKALLPFWGAMTCGQIDETSCKAYTSWRVGGGLRRAQLEAEGSSSAREKASRSPARRNLGVLRAALKSATKLLTHAPTVLLPDQTEPRPDWLTRSQVAAVVWALWTGRYQLKGSRWTKRTRETRHAARIMLAQFYTGSRPGTVARTTWGRKGDGPWIDLAASIWWPNGDDEEPLSRRAARMASIRNSLPTFAAGRGSTEEHSSSSTPGIGASPASTSGSRSRLHASEWGVSDSRRTL